MVALHAPQLHAQLLSLHARSMPDKATWHRKRSTGIGHMPYDAHNRQLYVGGIEIFISLTIVIVLN